MSHGNPRKALDTLLAESNDDARRPIHLKVDGRPAVELAARAAQRRSMLGEMTGGIAHGAVRNVVGIR